MRKGFKFCLFFGILFLIYSNCIVQAGMNLPRQMERITYFESKGNQSGLWLYDPVTTQKQLLMADINDNYQFSPDGCFLAFLVNNQDRGKGKSNTISLWVKDLTNGVESAVISDFDTDSNIDAQYQWIGNGELAVVQITEYGERKISIYQPDGQLIWTNPKEYQYICHSTDRVLLRNRTEQTLVCYHLLSQQLIPLPVNGLIINASISPRGDFLCYQTFKEIILVNLNQGDRFYIDVGELSGVEFDWSARQNFLIFQSKKRAGDEEFYQLTVFNVETSIKEFEVNSRERINYSWSSDDKQMVFSLYRNGWNVMVWFPEQYNTRSIQAGLAKCPIPLYQKQTHSFIYLDYVDDSPRIYSYDVMVNLLKLVYSGTNKAVWSNLEWVPACAYEIKRSTDNMYQAGFQEVKQIQFVRQISELASKASSYESILKWAPSHRAFVLKEDAQTLALIDSTGKRKQVFTGKKIGEPFWSTDGNHLAFIIESEPEAVVLYDVFRGQATSYVLPEGNYELLQWMGDRLWLFDGRLIRFYPLGNEWAYLKEWKEYWWSDLIVQPAHYRLESLWQVGANVWLNDSAGHFRVLTRLPENLENEWQALKNNWARWSPDDEQILYERWMSYQQNTENKCEIWTMDKSGHNQHYLCDGEQPAWLGNHRFLYLKDGNIHLANIGSGQLITLDTPKLTELAFMVSYDSAVIAVIARDSEEKIGLYFYEI